MKTVLVTGASSGIGLATAKALFGQGWSVVLLAKDMDSAKTASDLVRAAGGKGDAHAIAADLSSLEQTAGAAQEVKERFAKLDVLINNAGINPTKRSETVDGIESTFAVNYLAPFLLTNLLLDRLEQSAPSRVVTVASSVEKVMRIQLDLDDLRSHQDWGAQKAYGRSKQACILFTVELARRLAGRGVTANCLHPGIVGSNIFRDLPRPVQWIGKAVLPSPEKGARTSVFLASSPKVEGVSGKFFKKCEVAEASAAGTDAERARQLWDRTIPLVSAYLPPEHQSLPASQIR